MKTAYGYIRVSTNIQDTQRQHTSISDYCQKNQITLLQTFEEKESGTKSQRKALTALLNTRKTTKPDLVIVDELSRLGRTGQVIITVEELAAKGVCILTIKEGLKSLNDDGSENTDQILSFYINAGFARSEIIKTKARMKGGIVSAAQRGQFSGGGQIPYGFKLVQKPLNNTGKIRNFLEVEESEKQLLNELFNRFIQGDGVRKLGVWLNSTGFKTRKGKNWNIGSIYSILTNKILTGVRVMPDGLIVDSYPVVISPQLFNQVQELLKSRGNKIDNARKYEYLLDKGLCSCGVCGMNYRPVKSKNIGKKNVYECLSRSYTLTQPSCSNYGVNIDKLEKAVQDSLINYLPTAIQQHIDTSTVDAQINQLKEDQRLFNLQLIQANKKEQNLLNLAIQGIFNPNLLPEQAQAIQKEQQDLNQKIKTTEIQLQQLIEAKNNAVNLPALIAKLKTSGINRDLLRKIIKKIIITPSTTKLSTYKNDRSTDVEIVISDSDSIVFTISSRTTDYKLQSLKGQIFSELSKYEIINKTSDIHKTAKNLTIVGIE